MKSSGELEKRLSKFNEDQLKQIFENVGAIQLTEGCNTGCHDCGLGAKKGVRDYIPYNLLSRLFCNYGFQLRGKDIGLFYASEPLDYLDGEKKYFDVHQLFLDFVGECPSPITTSVPVGKERLVLKYLFNNNSLGTFFEEKPLFGVISLTKDNYTRVNESFLDFQKKEFLEEKFSSLDEFVQTINLRRKNHFDFLGYSILPEIRDYYNFCEGLDKLHTLSLGDSNLNNLSEEGVGCFHGILITPLNIFNLMTVRPSKEFPYGQILVPLEYSNFKLVEFSKFTSYSNDDAFFDAGEKIYGKLKNF